MSIANCNEQTITSVSGKIASGRCIFCNRHRKFDSKVDFRKHRSSCADDVLNERSLVNTGPGDLKDTVRILHEWKQYFGDAVDSEAIHDIFVKYLRRRTDIENAMIERINSSDHLVEINDTLCELEDNYPIENRPERVALIIEIAQQRMKMVLFLKVERYREEIERAIIDKITECETTAGIEKILCDLKKAFPSNQCPERISGIMEIAWQRMGIVREKERRSLVGI